MGKINVLICGDLFVTVDIFKSAMINAFSDSEHTINFKTYIDQWPAEPLTSDDEVREFVGDDDIIASLASETDVILTHSAPITLKVIESAPKLKVVAAARGGPVNVNVKACTQRGIPVFYGPGSKAGAVAEFTVGLMFAEMRSITHSHSSMKYDGEWRGDLYVYDRCGFEMSEATIGLIGLGAIGKRVAEIVRCFGAKVLVYDPFVDVTEIDEMGCVSVDIKNLLEQSDIISLHARVTNSSKGLIGKEEFELMKPTAYFVNTARAELVQENALIEALKTRKIAGAALDVFEVEPLPEDHPFHLLDNVTLASHLGGATREASLLGAQIAVGEVFNYIMGSKPTRFCINPEVMK